MTDHILIGKAALTVVRLEDGRRQNIPQGKPVPSSIAADDARRLVDEGFLERVELVESAGVPVIQAEIPLDDGLRIDPLTGAVLSTTGDVLVDGRPAADDTVVAEPSEPYTDAELDEVLALNTEPLLDEVGDDRVRAEQVLAAEQAKDKPRKGVVEGLEEVLAASEDDDQ